MDFQIFEVSLMSTMHLAWACIASFANSICKSTSCLLIDPLPSLEDRVEILVHSVTILQRRFTTSVESSSWSLEIRTLDHPVAYASSKFLLVWRLIILSILPFQVSPTFFAVWRIFITPYRLNLHFVVTRKPRWGYWLELAYTVLHTLNCL